MSSRMRPIFVRSPLNVFKASFSSFTLQLVCPAVNKLSKSPAWVLKKVDEIARTVVTERWMKSLECWLIYRKRGKIRWAKHSHFSWFSRVPWKFSRAYKCLSIIVLNNKHFSPGQCENISAKTSIGLKTWTFSPANLSPSTLLLTAVVTEILDESVVEVLVLVVVGTVDVGGLKESLRGVLAGVVVAAFSSLKCSR